MGGVNKSLKKERILEGGRKGGAQEQKIIMKDILFVLLIGHTRQY